MAATPEHPSESDELSRAELREATLRGVRWVAMGRVISEVAAFASSIVLARLIAPAAFGVVALAMFVTAIASVLAQQGIASAVVQRESITRAHLQAAMMLGLLVGLAGSALAFGLAYVLHGAFDAEAIDQLKLVCPAFLIVGISATPTAILQRRLNFRVLAMSEAASIVISVTVSVALAIAGMEAEALIFGILARLVTQAVILTAVARPPLPRWRREPMREISRFGIPAAMGSLGYQGYRNVDYAIVGAQLGMAQLGLYWRAYQLAFEYQQKISVVMQRMAFPIFSRGNDMDDMRALRFRIVRVHTTLIFPLLFAFIAVAPHLVPFLYGARWEPAVVPAQLLAISAFATPVMTGLGAVILAAGRPRALMTATWLVAGGYAAVVFVAAPHGLTVLCLAIVGYMAVRVPLTHHFLMYKIAGIPFRELRHEIKPALVSGLVQLAGTWSVVTLLDQAGVADPIIVALAGSFGALLYVAMLRHFFVETWLDVRLLGERVIGKRLARRRMRANVATVDA